MQTNESGLKNQNDLVKSNPIASKHAKLIEKSGKMIYSVIMWEMIEIMYILNQIESNESILTEMILFYSIRITMHRNKRIQ